MQNHLRQSFGHQNLRKALGHQQIKEPSFEDISLKPVEKATNGM